jgi:hypothetical protein
MYLRLARKFVTYVTTFPEQMRSRYIRDYGRGIRRFEEEFPEFNEEEYEPDYDERPQPDFSNEFHNRDYHPGNYWPSSHERGADYHIGRDGSGFVSAGPNSDFHDDRPFSASGYGNLNSAFEEDYERMRRNSRSWYGPSRRGLDHVPYDAYRQPHLEDFGPRGVPEENEDYYGHTKELRRYDPARDAHYNPGYNRSPHRPRRPDIREKRY